jgi:hypothetical protein
MLIWVDTVCTYLNVRSVFASKFNLSSIVPHSRNGRGRFGGNSLSDFRASASPTIKSMWETGLVGSYSNSWSLYGSRGWLVHIAVLSRYMAAGIGSE